jgi:hypothetical protein
MKVCVLGTARSGTTALYSLLQEIMLDHFGEEVDFVYEPFLWDKECFNDRYERVQVNFNYMDSISSEGIYNHRLLPLFISDPQPFLTNSYLRTLFQLEEKDKPILLKMIRLCGRYLLLRDICPETRFIYILRSPANAVNSLTYNFSFFGGEFHRDDYPRFLRELHQVYGQPLAPTVEKCWTEKELFFWYHMNKYALESFKKRPNPPLLLCYEECVRDREKTLQRVCDFLSLTVKSAYLERYQQKVGSITKEFRISQGQMSCFQRYVPLYLDLLTENGIPHSLDSNQLLEKYEVSEEIAPPIDRALYGLNPLVLMRRCKELRDIAAELTQKNLECQTTEKGMEATPAGALTQTLMGTSLQAEPDAAHPLSLSVLPYKSIESGQLTRLNQEVGKLTTQLASSEADRAARLEVIHQQGQEISQLQGEIHKRLQENKSLWQRLNQEQVERQQIQSNIVSLNHHLEAVQAFHLVRLEMLGLHEKELSRAREEIGYWTKLHQEEMKEHELIRTDLAQKQSAWGTERSRLEEQVHSLEKERYLYQSQASQLQNQVETQAREAATRELELHQTRAGLGTQASLVQSMRAELESLTAEKKYLDEESQILQEEVSRLGACLRDQQMAWDDLNFSTARMREELESHRLHATELQQQQQALGEQIQQALGQLKADQQILSRIKATRAGKLLKQAGRWKWLDEAAQQLDSLLERQQVPPPSESI